VRVRRATARKAETLKRFSQHGSIFLTVVAVPSFSQCKGADSIIWNGGFADFQIQADAQKI